MSRLIVRDRPRPTATDLDRPSAIARVFSTEAHATNPGGDGRCCTCITSSSSSRTPHHHHHHTTPHTHTHTVSLSIFALIFLLIFSFFCCLFLFPSNQCIQKPSCKVPAPKIRAKQRSPCFLFNILVNTRFDEIYFLIQAQVMPLAVPSDEPMRTRSRAMSSSRSGRL